MHRCIANVIWFNPVKERAQALYKKPPAHRLLRWLVTTVTNQAVVDRIDARRIFVPGGYQELARIVGAGTGRKAAVQVRDILLWQAAPQQFVITDPETGQQEVIREGNLLTFNYTPSGFKSQASLEIIIGTHVDATLFIQVDSHIFTQLEQ